MESVEIRLEKFRTSNKNKIEAIGVQNGKIKEVLALINNTKPNKNNFFVIDGIWAHEKALNNDLEVDSFIYCPEVITSHEAMNLIESFFMRAKKTYEVSLKTFMKICEKDDPKGMISICKFPLSDLRTCDGADIDAVFICNRRARITHPKIVKGSMGAAFTKPIVEFSSVEECKAWLKKKNFKIYLTDTRATKTYFEEDYEGRVALIVGSERYGITKPWYEGDYEMIMIPMLGQCDSLNVAIATTIIAYEASLKQKGFIKEKRK